MIHARSRAVCLSGLVLATSIVLTSGACGNVGAECQPGAACAAGDASAGHDGSPGKRPVGPDGGKATEGGSAARDAGAGDASSLSHPPTLDATGADARALDAPAGEDSSSPVPTGDSGVCVPQNNGVIAPDEYPMMAGLHANYEFADNVTIDTAGVTNTDGSHSWDLTGPYSGDHTVFVTTNAPIGQWYSSDYPGATYTTPLSDTSTLLGVFQGTASSLVMLGVASPGSGNGQTDLTYAPPAEFVSVPMQVGTSWSSKSTITGLAQGLVANYTEQYASKVDAYGTIKVPYGTFSVLEIQTTLTRTMLGVTTTIQSLSYVAECFGPVAAATSQSNETQTHFTSAAEVRRLTP